MVSSGAGAAMPGGSRLNHRCRGPPKRPLLPGLRHAGLDAHQLVWVQVETPAERLWPPKQLINANAWAPWAPTCLAARAFARAGIEDAVRTSAAGGLG